MQNEKKLVEDVVESAAKGAVKGSLEAVPIYQDALQPAAKQIGQTLQTVTRAINAALGPLKAFVWSYEQAERFIYERVGKKLENTPIEQIVTPAANVAVPAIQNLMLTGDEPALTELYANLLATAMDQATAADAHPAFAETIRQMNSDEAKVFTAFGDSDSWPCIQVRLVNTATTLLSFEVLVPVFSSLGEDYGCAIPMKIGAYLDNLERLGLIRVNFERRIADNEVYEPLKNHPQIKDLESDERVTEHTHVEIEMGQIRITEYGTQFFDACVTSKDSDSN